MKLAGRFCTAVGVLFLVTVVGAFFVESLPEVWPQIWQPLWGKIIVADLYVGFLATALAMKVAFRWSNKATAAFFFCSCFLGNILSMLVLGALLNRR